MFFYAKVVDYGQKLCYNHCVIKIKGVYVMFFGTYFHQMDSKNRIRIPSRFSKELGTTYVIGRSAMENTLAIYPLEAFKKISQKKHSPFNRQAEMAYTLFFGSYFEVTEDGQGRLQITEAIKKFAPLEKDIVFVGAEDHINLMSKSQYDSLSQSLSYDDALAILDEQYEKHQD